MRFPRLGRIGVAAALRLPQGCLRRVVGQWALRELGSGSLNRRDYTVIDKFTTDDLEVVPAPDVSALLPAGSSVFHGSEAFQRFLEGWYEQWGSFTFVLKEVIDLGDGRVVLLHHLQGRGASSGVELMDKEEAQLWEVHNGLVSRVQQWWSWREALQAVGPRE